MARIVRDFLDKYHFAYSKKSLRKLESRLIEPRMRMAIPFIYEGSGHYRTIAPQQNQEEFLALAQRVEALAPKVVLEIGTYRGGSLYAWCQMAAEDATIISLDLPENNLGYLNKRKKLYELFAKPKQSMHFLKCDSHAQSSLDSVKEILQGKEVDFLFIDGDHSYEGVKSDFEDYSRLVCKEGLIALHDVADCENVIRFWKELESQYPTEMLKGSSLREKILGIGMLENSER